MDVKRLWPRWQYAHQLRNVVNVAATSEEFALLIGTGRSHGKGDEFEVDLNDRVIMTPQTAKRLAAARKCVQHEQRYGTIDVSAQPPTPETNTAVTNWAPFRAP